MSRLSPCQLIANYVQDFLVLTRKQQQGRVWVKPTGAIFTALKDAYGTFRSNLPGLLSVIGAKNTAVIVSELDKINIIKLAAGANPEYRLVQWYYQNVNPVCGIKLTVNGAFVIDPGKK